MESFKLENTQYKLRVFLGVVICLLCINILLPFVGVALWGGIIAVACDSLTNKISKKIHSDFVAAIFVGVVLAIVIVLPLVVSISQAINQVQLAIEWGKEAVKSPWPSLPQSVVDFPFGGLLVKTWDYVGAEGLAQVEGWAKVHASDAAGQAASFAGEVSGIAGKAILSLIIAVVLMGLRVKVLKNVVTFSQKAVGEIALDWLGLCASAIRGVAIGVCGTALTLSIGVAVGLTFAGIPAVSLLACITMVLCITQIGPLPVLAPCALYLAVQSHYAGAVSLGVLMVFLSVVDGVMRPYLIGRELKMPMILIFIGVIGGLMSMGLMGVFLGPMFMAMGLKVVSQWMTSSSNYSKNAGDDNNLE